MQESLPSKARKVFLAGALLWSAISPLGAALSAEAATYGPPPAADRLRISVGDLGYPSGLTMDQPDGYAGVHFELPRDVRLKGGVLRLHYVASPLLGPYANMRVYLDDSPRTAVSLYHAQADHWLAVPLSPLDLRQRYLALTIKGSLITSADRCFDQRINGGYLQVLPDSNLTLHYQDARLSSIRGFWDTLGHRVFVGLPAAGLPPSGLDAAWQVAHTLRSLGHEVAFTTAPSTCDIALTAPASSSLTAPSTGSVDIHLTSVSSHPVLEIDPPYSSALLSSPWLALARGGRIEGGFRSVPAPPNGKPYVALLSELGFQDGLQQVSSTTDWSMRVQADKLPPRYKLTSLRLDVLSAPSQSGRPTAFDVYLNGTLIRAARLDDTGEPQTLQVQLPDYLVQGDNTLRFVAMRTDTQGDCKGGLTTYPIQILPSSTLTAAPDLDPPAVFSDLPSEFAGPLEVYLSRSEIADPGRTLLLLSRLSADLGFDPQNAKLTAEAPATGSTEPFIWLRNQPPAGFAAPVRFDRGQIEAVTSRGRVLLETGRLPGIAIAQMLVDGTRCGLWIRSADPSRKLPVPGQLFLKQGDIAFMDQSEVLLTLDSHHPDLARIAYPAYQDWWTVIGTYRYWIFAALWILLTAGAVSLFRRLRKAP